MNTVVFNSFGHITTINLFLYSGIVVIVYTIFMGIGFIGGYLKGKEKK